jgi:hypothetical protein
MRLILVSDGGATIETTDGTSYAVSPAGIMRYAAAQWSTGDSVTVCRSKLSDGTIPASIANPRHFDKVQATVVGQETARAVTCHDTSIASVADGGVTVRTSDGRSYDVSRAGVMRYSVQQWTTAERVAVCEARAFDGTVAASLENPQHFDKVQASRN